MDVSNTEADTLFAALQQVWSRQPDQVALVQGDRRVTYDQLAQAVIKLAVGYRRLGVAHGDRVICAITNRPESVMALGAAWACGALHVGVDYQFTAAELGAVIELTQAKVLLCEAASPIEGNGGDFAERIRALRQRFPTLIIVVVGEGEQEDVEPCVLPLAKVMAGDLSSPGTWEPEAKPPEAAMIFISSGTTGKPKAAIGYHGNLCQRWRRLGGWLRFGPEDVHLAQLPLSHGFGLMMAVAALLAGGRLVLLDDFTAESALQLVTREGVTVLNGAPTHFKLILNRLDPQRHDVSSLRLSVGTAAAFPPPLVQAIWERLGVEIMFMYGSSEGVGVATTDREEILRGAVGRPAPGAVAIVGPDHRPLPIGETGEIVFSRQVYPVTYWDGAAGNGTRNIVQRDVAQDEDGWSDDGAWFYSGDLGRLDEEGRLYVFGRLKHLIDRGGIKVDPVEVEMALLQTPGVADGAVIGIPNPMLGETVCACVVPESAPPPTLEHLRAHLSGTLASYKLPEELCIVEEIRRTPIGKVDVKWLRSEVMAANGQYEYHR